MNKCNRSALACALFFLLSINLHAESRSLQEIYGSGIESIQSTDRDYTWWITTDRIDPVAESRAIIDRKKAGEEKPKNEEKDKENKNTDAAESHNVDNPEASSKAKWKPVMVPADAASQGYAQNFREGVYYRKAFYMPERLTQSFTVRLGEISDRDRVYLNGTLIAQTGEWDSTRPQGYDRQRLYDIPDHLLIRGGVNVLIVHVQGYFPWELGIYRDRTEIGPTSEILRDYYLENIYQLLSLIVYFTAGAYFLFLFIRQRHDRENMYFGIFVLLLVIYSLLRTQFKYILHLDISFYALKRFQYTSLFPLAASFYFFIRHYYGLPDKTWAKWWDRFFLYFSIVPFIAIVALYATDSVMIWERYINNYVAQPSWLVHIVGILFILTRSCFQLNRDAITMMGTLVFTLATVAIDILSSLSLINLPTLTTYSFSLFILGIALILANRFVRVSENNRALNIELTGTNKAMNRFVPMQFLSFLGHQKIIDVNIGDQTQREMTVLFSDIRSFTTLSEGMTPKENFDFINSYLRRVGPIIRKHGGFIDKYIGDAIMALFPGSPLEAVQASVEMHKRVSDYNKRRVEVGYDPISIGIGLHTGMLMLGTIGEEERMDGTVISDNVNLASRLESLTKQYGSSVLISDALMKLIPKDAFHLRFVDRVIVKGKSTSISVYEILEADEEAEMAKKLQTKDAFEKGVEFYTKQDFNLARQMFEKVLATHSTDKAAELYLGRSKYYAEHGVPLDWEGVEEMKTK